MTINIGAVAITFIGLVVGLAGLGLAWRMVRGLSMDEHPTPSSRSDEPDRDTEPSEPSENDD